MCIRDRIRDTPITVTDERETVVRDTPGHQPDKPIQKEDMSMQEMLKIIMEKMDRNHETLKQIMNDRKHMIEEMMNDRNKMVEEMMNDRKHMVEEMMNDRNQMVKEMTNDRKQMVDGIINDSITNGKIEKVEFIVGFSFHSKLSIVTVFIRFLRLLIWRRVPLKIRKVSSTYRP